LSPTNVDTDYLQTLLPKAKLIEWDVENEEEPERWMQDLWEFGFGCGEFSWVVDF
jgi:hypothetical protein